MSKHHQQHKPPKQSNQSTNNTSPTANESLKVFEGEVEAEAEDFYYGEQIGEYDIPEGGFGMEELYGEGAEGEEEVEDEGGTGDAGMDSKEIEEVEEEEQNGQEAESKLVKPHIWMRIMKPGTIDSSIYEISDDRKTLGLTVKPEDRLFQKKTGKPACFSFETEGILLDEIQDDIYDFTVKEVVENAVEGVNGVVICVGPEASGKSFTLFGQEDNYQLRGVLPRAIEDIFAAVKSKGKGTEYHIILSMFEIRKERIKDLLTLSPQQLSRVGEFGPKGLFFEEVLSVDHAFKLLLRGLAGQQQIPREWNEKYHTLVYIDILAKIDICDNPEPEEWRSRITFAKIAASPGKANDVKQGKKVQGGRGARKNFSLCRGGRSDMNSMKRNNCHASAPGVTKRCCCGGGSAALADMISIRKDMSFLEQMFSKFYDLRKINDYYNCLQKAGIYMSGKPPASSSSQYRQNKLAYCLKDIVSGTSLVRLIIHIRPERAFLHSTIEVMRLAERARCIPCKIPNNRKSCQSMEQKMAKVFDEIGATNNTMDFSERNVSPDKLRDIHKLAMQYFEEKLDTLEGPCKEQVKTMFEGFKDMWNHFLEKEVDEAKEAPNEAAIEEGGDDEPHDKEMSVRESTVSSKKGKEDAKSLEKDDRKNKKNRKISVSKTKSKNRPDSGKDGDDSANEASIGKKKNKSGAKSLAISVLDTDDENDEETTDDHHSKDDKNGASELCGPGHTSAVSLAGEVSSPANDLAFKRKCWKAFEKSEVGSPLLTDFDEKHNAMKQLITDHDEALKEAVTFLPKLIQLKLNEDEMEKEKLFHEEHTEIAKELPTPKGSSSNLPKLENALKTQQDLLDKLQALREAIVDQLSTLGATKKICQKAFEKFCSDTFGKSPADLKNLPLNCLENALSALAQEALGFPKLDLSSTDSQAKMKNDAEAEKRFHELYQNAKLAAETMIKKSYPKRPAWTMYY